MTDDNDSHSSSHSSEWNDTDICRVCLGPSESDLALFQPCICSGSIAHVHQPCLEATIAEKRIDKCPVCHYKYQFQPVFRDNTPEQLSFWEVVIGLVVRAGCKWVPYVLRLVLVLLVWFVALPLLTSLVYIAWMERPNSIFLRLLKYWNIDAENADDIELTTTNVIGIDSHNDTINSTNSTWTYILTPSSAIDVNYNLIFQDIISGLEITATIVISALSLLSLVDHFRLNWQPLRRRRRRRRNINRNEIENLAQQQLQQNNNHNNNVNNDNDDDDVQVIEDDILHEQLFTLLRDDGFEFDNSHKDFDESVINDNQMSLSEEMTTMDTFNQSLESLKYGNNENNKNTISNSDDRDNDTTVQYDIDAQFERMMKLQEEAESEEDDDDDDDEDFQFNQNINNEENPLEPPEPALPANEQEPLDMENAMPIDEIIGLRGPISSLVRNLLWFLAFNTSYLGMFARLPRLVGGLTFHQYSRSKIISRFFSIAFEHILLLPFVKFIDDSESKATLDKVFTLLREETMKRDNILRPDDVGKLVLGYISIAQSVFIMQRVLRYFRKNTQRQQGPTSVRYEIGDIHREELRHQHIQWHREEIDMEHGVHRLNLSDCLECICDIAKVSILIFLKMVLLPFLLGYWLDISTLSVFKGCMEDIVLYAGVDFVGFFLLHWVVGITFMLVVTVSVLQFREVLHPDLLSRIIRPQESQPDMIANLLQDDGWTHTRRIIPSLGIYAALLALHIWLPAMILSKYGFDQFIPLFRPKLWYLVSKKLQVPLELLGFHLVMLSMLEKHKNRIGESQHAFLVKLCKTLNLTDSLLPCSINGFELVAKIPLKQNDPCPKLIYSKGLYRPTSIDPFWDKIITMQEDNLSVESIMNEIESRLQNINTSSQNKSNETLGDDSFQIPIAIPIFEKDILNSSSQLSFAKKQLPHKIGNFRLRRTKSSNSNQDFIIEIWKEVIGRPITRPPDGWDYIGNNGGAVVQGRWAWDKEEKSDIEKSLARRKLIFYKKCPNAKLSKRHFYMTSLVILKLIVLLFLSWATVTCCAYGAFVIPLVIGRCLYSIFEVPDHYTHDPFVFLIGSVICYPIMIKFVDSIRSTEIDKKKPILSQKLKELMNLPREKMSIIIQAVFFWTVLSPVFLGMIYKSLTSEEQAILSSNFESAINFQYLIHAWAIGLILIHVTLGILYISTLKQGLWTRLVGILFNDNNDNNNVMGENANDQDNIYFSNITKMIRSIVIDSEWDKLDRKVFVEETALPIAKILIKVFVCATLSSFGMNTALEYYDLSASMSRTALHRVLTSLIIVGACVSSFAKQLNQWFRRFYGAAHKTAKQRYILGHVLLDRMN